MPISKIRRVAFVTTFPPRECGIAVYVDELVKSMECIEKKFKVDIIAIDDVRHSYSYPKRVKTTFLQNDVKEYLRVVEYLNNSSVDLLNIQHEFGLYGTRVCRKTLGKDDGKNILIFYKYSKKPIITTLHMVYKSAPPAHKKIVKNICDISLKIIVLAENAKKVLVRSYGVKKEKIFVIPHGVPDFSDFSKEKSRIKLSLPRQKQIIFTYGLIRAKKGYEYLIEAVPAIIKKFPRAYFIILGRTHSLRDPTYLKQLKQKVEEKGLTHHVEFIEKYSVTTELLHYLVASDIFITPFTIMNQVSSATLPYGLAAGCVCVSTPYDFAKDVINDQNGIFVPSKDSRGISKGIMSLLSSPQRMKEMSWNATSGMKSKQWSMVGEAYLDCLKNQ